MSRWIVFDQPAAEAVARRAGIRPELRNDTLPAKVVDVALHSRAALAVLPGEQPGSALLMRVSRPQPSVQVPSKPASNLAPAGFLGLSDSIDMDSEPERPKKWWQKILD